MLDRKTKNIDARDELLFDRLDTDVKTSKIYCILFLVFSIIGLIFFSSGFFSVGSVMLFVGLISFLTVIVVEISIKYKGLILLIKKEK